MTLPMPTPSAFSTMTHNFRASTFSHNSYISVTLELLRYGFVHKALISGLMLALAGGILGPIIVGRRLSFTVHASSELALTGAAAALWLNLGIALGATLGALIAAAAVAWLAHGKSDKDAITAVVMSFGLGIAVLLLHLYPGRKTIAFQLLTGEIIAINNTGFASLIIICCLVIIISIFLYPKIILTTLEPELAASQGYSTRMLSLCSTVCIALVTAQAMQVVGSLLVMSLLITPAAAARYIAHSMTSMLVWSVIFAVIAAVGGILVSLSPGWPVSAPITTIAFGLYIAARSYHQWKLHRI